MRFLIIGANGQTGQMIVDRALYKGHTVTALVRNEKSLMAKPGLKIVIGTPAEEQDIEAAITSTSDLPSAILIALGTTVNFNPLKTSDPPSWLMSTANRNAIEAMRRHGIKKIVTLSAFGVADSFPNLNFLMRLTISYTAMATQFADHVEVDRLLKDSGMDFTLVRPAMLKGDEALPVKHIGDHGQGASFMPSISRASVAQFMLDAATSEEWTRRTPVICN